MELSEWLASGVAVGGTVWWLLRGRASPPPPRTNAAVSPPPAQALSKPATLETVSDALKRADGDVDGSPAELEFLSRRGAGLIDEVLATVRPERRLRDAALEVLVKLVPQLRLEASLIQATRTASYEREQFVLELLLDVVGRLDSEVQRVHYRQITMSMVEETALRVADLDDVRGSMERVCSVLDEPGVRVDVLRAVLKSLAEGEKSDVVEKLLAHPHPDIRTAALEADPSLSTEQVLALSQDANARVRAALLGTTATSGEMKLLLQLATDPSPVVRLAAVEALAVEDDEEASAMVATLAQDADASVALRAAAELAAPNLVELVDRAMVSDDRALRLVAAQIAPDVLSTEKVCGLISALELEGDDVVLAALVSSMGTSDPVQMERLVQLAKSNPAEDVLHELVDKLESDYPVDTAIATYALKSPELPARVRRGSFKIMSTSETPFEEVWGPLVRDDEPLLDDAFEWMTMAVKRPPTSKQKSFLFSLMSGANGPRTAALAQAFLNHVG